MNLPFFWLPAPLVTSSLCAVLATVVLGLIGTLKALGQKPALVLRNL
jgi:putative ABC transport system permease protein